MTETCLFAMGDGGVGVISLNRPDKMNILNLEMRDALIDSISIARDHPDIRALVLRANGEHFSAGADLSEFGSADTIFDARRIRWERDPWGPLWQLQVPTIVALHGVAVGAGLEIALLCDVRLAASNTVLGLPETKLGMVPAAGGTQTLPKAVGTSLALPLVATGDRLTATDAQRRRIVHRVVDDVEDAAMNLASRLAQLDQVGLSAAKRCLHAAAELPLETGLRTEQRLAALVDRASHGGQTRQKSAEPIEGST